MDDHCTLWPEGNWGEACCKPHDDSFDVGGTLVDFLVSNWQLGVCVVETAESWQIVLGGAMAIGTTLLGWSRWRWWPRR